ncbi:10784_t:CDS:2 [Gigaspora rosea]|nr:10784_t:CDS:2 [Gigaspora rosea]
MNANSQNTSFFCLALEFLMYGLSVIIAQDKYTVIKTKKTMNANSSSTNTHNVWRYLTLALEQCHYLYRAHTTTRELKDRHEIICHDKDPNLRSQAFHERNTQGFGCHYDTYI